MVQLRRLGGRRRRRRRRHRGAREDVRAGRPAARVLARWPTSCWAPRTPSSRATSSADRECSTDGLAENDGHPNLVFTARLFPVAGQALRRSARVVRARDGPAPRGLQALHGRRRDRAVESGPQPRLDLRQAEPLRRGAAVVRAGAGEQARLEPAARRHRAHVRARRARSTTPSGCTARAPSATARRAFTAYANFLLRRRRFAQAFELVDRRAEPLGDRAYVTLLLSAATDHPRRAAGRSRAVRAARARARAGQRHRAGPARRALRRARRRREARAPARRRARRAAARRRGLRPPLAPPARGAARRRRARRRPSAGSRATPHDPVLHYNAALAAARLGRDDVARAQPRRHRGRLAARALGVRAAGRDRAPGRRPRRGAGRARPRRRACRAATTSRCATPPSASPAR